MPVPGWKTKNPEEEICNMLGHGLQFKTPKRTGYPLVIEHGYGK
jgi:hypothetical protein